MVKRLIASLGIFMSLTAIFFLSSFAFENSQSGSHSYYMAETVCTGSSAESLCKNEPTSGMELFRGHRNEPKHVFDTGARYVSSSFSEVVNVISSPNDTLRVATIKASMVRAAIGAALLIYCLQLVLANSALLGSGIRLVLVLFGFPYMIFGIASPYPSPIAAVAMTAGLLTVQRLVIFDTISRLEVIGRLIALTISFWIIGATRFETFALFTVAATVIWVRQITLVFQFSKTRAIRLLGYVIFTLAFAAYLQAENEELGGLLVQAATGQAQVLSLEQASKSRGFRVLGEMAFALQAPLGFIDNSTRNLGNRFLDAYRSNAPLPHEVALVLDVIFRCLAWSPMMVVIYGVLRRTLSSLKNGTDWFVRIFCTAPVLLFTGIFFSIPGLARTPLFYWYGLPILLSLVSSEPVSTSPTRWEKSLLYVSLCVNLLGVYMAHTVRGDLHVANQIIPPHVMFALTLLATGACIVCLSSLKDKVVVRSSLP